MTEDDDHLQVAEAADDVGGLGRRRSAGGTGTAVLTAVPPGRAAATATTAAPTSSRSGWNTAGRPRRPPPMARSSPPRTRTSRRTTCCASLQREAHRAVREHFAESDDPAIIVIPVGCGKTGIIATLPFGIARGRVLVITPNLTIRKGVTDALDISSRECFWARTRVLSDFTAGPWTAVLDGPAANINDCIESQFVVTDIRPPPARPTGGFLSSRRTSST